MSLNLYPAPAAKRLTSILILLAIFGIITSAAGCAAQQTTKASIENTPASAQRISLLDGRVSLIPPDGFHRATVEELKYKLPSNYLPLLLLTDDDQSGYITIGLDEQLDYQSEDLTYIKELTERQLRGSGENITRSEFLTLGGRRWAHLVYEAHEKSELEKLEAPPAEGEKPRKIYDESPVRFRGYSTILGGKLLTIDFVCPVGNHPQLEPDFERSIRSIQVKD